jgi:LPS-assembly protein
MAGGFTSLTPSRKSRLLGAVAGSVLLAVLGQGLCTPVFSQTLNDQLNQRAGQQKSRLLVDAREIVYNNDKNLVEARGDVQLYYQGRILEADRVTYDRNTKRVYAEGNAKLVEANGNTIYSDRFELTDDFKDGFIDSLRVVSPDKQRITAARGERTDGETTVFERGTYTSCEACKDNPEKPPLWQIKAARIIAKNSEQMIYYEDARLEFFGLPLAYIPFFSAPDPTVARKSGILTPRYSRSSATGYRFSLPIYWAPAPHFDVLWTPSALSKQGMLNEVEWRHRLETGIYNIRVAGIFQADPGAFLPGPAGPNRVNFGSALPRTVIDPKAVPGWVDVATGIPDKRLFRGSIETTGQFLINKNWKFGWDVALLSDKYFVGNYRVKSESVQLTYFKESISSVYLRGQTERAYFDATASYTQGLTQLDWQKQLPVVHPVIDYNRRFQPGGVIGGELALDVNITSLSREVADFVALPTADGGRRFASSTQGMSQWFGPTPLFAYYLGNQQLASYYGCGSGYGPTIFNGVTNIPYPTVPLASPGRLIFPNNLIVNKGYVRGDCLLRGAAGNINRASTVISWRRKFIDPLGQVWTPFISAQLDVTSYSLNTTSNSADPYRLNGNTVFGNDKQTNFLSSSDTSVRAMPSVGLEYRYPLVANSSFGTHLFEPIAQIIASPNEQKIGKLPNEDAQSLVFSDSNLFSLNRFSGYDRAEGGIRANVGAQFTTTFTDGGYLNALVGQSYHLSGRNSFAADPLRGNDQVNTGLNSGLDKSRSDYVARFAYSPNKQISFIARGRFDEESLKLQRLEVSASGTFGDLTSSILYARQEAQPDLGFVRRREGLSFSNTLQLPNKWYTTGSIVLDLDRYSYDRDYAEFLRYYGNTAGVPLKYDRSPFRLTSYSLGLGYVDECTTFSVTYSRAAAENIGAVRTTTSTVFFRLELKHLGQLNYRQAVNSSSTVDGTR